MLLLRVKHWYIWHRAHLISVHQVLQYTGRSKSTVVVWFNLCRDVTIYKFDKRSKLDEKYMTVQIDESLFQGKYKFNRVSISIL